MCEQLGQFTKRIVLRLLPFIATSRVTRLGGFLLSGRLSSLGSFLITEVAQILGCTLSTIHAMQGCQMAYIQTKNRSFGKIWWAFKLKNVVIFYDLFGMFHGYLV
jgi:hypothetical protein